MTGSGRGGPPPMAGPGCGAPPPMKGSELGAHVILIFGTTHFESPVFARTPKVKHQGSELNWITRTIAIRTLFTLLIVFFSTKDVAAQINDASALASEQRLIREKESQDDILRLVQSSSN